MSTALPSLATAAGRLASGREVVMAGTAAAPGGPQWCLQRNCSSSPTVLFGLYGVLVLVSLGIAAFFWVHGAPLVLPFALLELTAVGLALIVYARHAVDGERLRLEHGRLVVERRRGLREDRFEFDAHWVRLSAAPGGAIDLREGRRGLRVGACAATGLRTQALREINEVLARLRRGGVAGCES
jgi:uncharacterized membrane protein